MIARHWGIIVALGVSALISTALYVTLQPRQPELPAYEYGQGGAGDYEAGGSQCRPAVLAAIPDRPEAARERDRCAEAAEAYRLQRDDLVQQTRSANAAEAQAWLSHHLAWLGLYGTIGGFLTLVAATAAAIYARDAAKAANASLDHSRDISGLELRPWIDFTIQPFRIDKNDEGLDIAVIIHLRNTGKRPALRVRTGVRTLGLFSGDDEIIQEFFDSAETVDEARFERTMLPGAEGEIVVTDTLPESGLVDPDGSHNDPIFPLIAINIAYCWTGDDVGGLTSKVFVIGPQRKNGDVVGFQLTRTFPIGGKLGTKDRGLSHAT